MSRNKLNKSDILSGAGALFEGYRILKDEHGVIDEDWRGMLSDKAIAAQVAAVLHPVAPETGLKDCSFAGLVKAGNLTPVFDYMDPDNYRYWTNRGERVRGQFQLVRMYGDYTETEAKEVARRTFGYYIATAYELADYASNGWNGTDTVVAFGSSFMRILTSPKVAYLCGDGHDRLMGLALTSSRQSRDHYVLCVSW